MANTKTWKLKLSYPHGKGQYRVESLTDTTEYAPGQILDKKVVDQLCESHRWKVTVVPAKDESPDDEE